MKFIADAMLGSLAKRMRLLGMDVLYDPSWDDNEIIRLARAQDLVILTRDTAFAARPIAFNNLFIKTDDLENQLEQVRSAFPDISPFPLTRCSVCNDTLLPVSKMNVQNLVPQQVYDKCKDFLQCPKCGRTYWQGTHVQRMKEPIKKK